MAVAGERLTLTEGGHAMVELRTSCWLSLLMLTPPQDPHRAGLAPGAEPALTLKDLLVLAKVEKREDVLNQA